MSDSQFIELVHKMRKAQKSYFKNRMNRDLQESKELERTVDYEISKRIIDGATPAEKTGKLF